MQYSHFFRLITANPVSGPLQPAAAFGRITARVPKPGQGLTQPKTDLHVAGVIAARNRKTPFQGGPEIVKLHLDAVPDGQIVDGSESRTQLFHQTEIVLGMQSR